MSEVWPAQPLGEICDVLDKLRKPITKRDRVPGEFPYYGATGILDHVEDYIFDEPLILIGEDGAKWGSGENTAFAVAGKCWVNNHAHVIRPHRDVVDDRWVIHFLNHSDLSPFITGLTVPKLNQGKLNSIPIPIPEVAEQKRIVAILDEVFGAIDRAKRIAEKNLSNAVELFDSYLNRVFTEKGEGWEETTLGDVCDFQNGYAFKSKWYTDHGIRLLRNANVSHGFVDWSSDVVRLPEEQTNEFSRFSLNEGDVVLSLDRPVISTGLKAAILSSSDIPSLLLQRVLRITSKRISQEFIFHWLFSNHFLAAIDPGRSLGVPHISAKEVGSVEISFPSSISDQNRIVKHVATVKESTRAMECLIAQKIAALDELKQSILQKAFTGQLTAKSPELEAVP